MLTTAAAYLNYLVLGRTVGMWSNNYGNPVWFLIAAFAGIGFTVTIAQFINFKWLISVGKNSIFYYGIHIILVEIFVKVINGVLGMPTGILAYIASFALAAISIVILKLLYPLYDRLYKKVLSISKI